MNELVKNDKFQELCDQIGSGRQAFFRRTLNEIITFKIWLGRTLVGSEFYGKYGSGFFEEVARATGISQTSLKDGVEMVEVAKLTTEKAAKEFIKSFPENYSSWNDCKRKLLGRGEEVATSGGCEHEWTCGKCGIKK